MSTTTEQGAPKQGNKRGLYIALIILLILLNVFFVFDNYTTKQAKAQLEREKMELDSSYAVLQDNYSQKILELQDLMGDNDSLNAIIQEQINSLQQLQEELTKAKSDAARNYNNYKAAKKKLAELEKHQEYINHTIDSLVAANQYLLALSDSLATDLQTSQGMNQQLQNEKKVLSQKVEIGSLLKPQNVMITGIRIKGNGTERETNSSKKAEKLRFCFDVPENKVADPGEKTILLRVIGPSGSTIAVASMGSGVFVSADNGEQMQYTTKATFEYQNKTKSMCIYWSQTQSYASGTYKAMFYQNGYEIGNFPFELK